jgi:hypothetical protein
MSVSVRVNASSVSNIIACEATGGKEKDLENNKLE